MATMDVFYFLLLVLFSCCFPAACGEHPPMTANGGDDRLRTYIIHVLQPPARFASHREWHESFLLSANVSVADRLLYSYSYALNGFAARLTEIELQAVREIDGFLQAQPDRLLSLHTTHTPSFLGLQPTTESFWGGAGGYGTGIIIGVLDTGISPAHPSFDDKGMGPPPLKWRGQCEFGNASLCNNKLIGARVFTRAGGANGLDATPFDRDGHGSHVAGTAAGGFVDNASLLGSANGTASGVAPLSHIAVYNVCFFIDACFEADVVAGIDSAVRDGVDIISASLGGPSRPFHADSFAIALFGAVRNGVLVSASAGNSGPVRGSVGNDAPWILTVGAGTMNRRISAVVRLGNGDELEGESAYQPANFSSTLLPLSVPGISDVVPARSCLDALHLDRIDVNGKIVLCLDSTGSDKIERGEIVKAAGGAAMIVQDSAYDTSAEPHVIPASEVSNFDGSRILEYNNSTAFPTATIVFNGTQIRSRSSDPAVAAFSSRGPSENALGVLKPDVIGPGVNVLAAWHETVGPNDQAAQPPFNMISGTSMSCPHLSGVAALLKHVHPDWSPARIRSAIMTTTDITNLNGTAIVDNEDLNPANVYATGAGHVNPARAANPGLVYDIETDDYVSYLCSLGYTDLQVTTVVQRLVTCYFVSRPGPANLNYPSLEIRLAPGDTRTVRRTLTNVGQPSSTYAVQVSPPPGVKMSVVPEVLNFAEVGRQLSFSVSFQLLPEATNLTSSVLEGALTWVSSNGCTRVRSPVAVMVTS